MRTVAAIAGLAFSLAGGSGSGANGIFALSWNDGGWVTSTSLRADGFWPVSSPDERQIAFVSASDGVEAVWVMSFDGTDQHRITSQLRDGAAGIGQLTWSPDGKTIAFTATFSVGPDSRYWSQRVYVVSSSGGEPRLVDDNTWGPPAFSADSKLLAYGVYQTGIGVTRADGSGKHEFQHRSRSPKWAPRDHRILALRDGRAETLDSAGHLRWILRGYNARAAAWTRDGRVVFLTSGTRHPGLYVVRPGSQRARRVVDIAGGRTLALSADSRYAAVTAAGSTYLVRLSGGYFARLGDEASLLAWSPDDDRLGFITEIPSMTFADVHGRGSEFGFDGNPEFFGFTWNGGRLIVASRGVNWSP